MKKEELRIVFMGTPDFAVASLRALVESGYQVVAVVTQPDKPVGRHGSVLQAPAVKQYALSQGLPVLQPEKMKDPDFIDQLRSYDANLQVVVAFRMLPEVVWAMPKYGTFNVHAALLPDYRGAAPINWAVINGERRTGVTTFFLDQHIDTGRIIRQEPFDIPDDADVEYVYDGLMQLGADVCLKTLEDILKADGYPASLPQDESLARHAAPKLFKDNCRISWDAPMRQVYNLVRGLSPQPGAWTMIQTAGAEPAMLKIYQATPTDKAATALASGTIVRDRKHLYIACSDHLLQVDSLQLAGKKRMDALSLMNGMADIENYSAI